MPMNMVFLLEDRAQGAPLGELWRRPPRISTRVRRNGAGRREAARGGREALLQNARMRPLLWQVVLLLAACGPTFAQGPAPESDALAARFPDPVVAYRTPAFEPGHEGVTSNAE